MKNYDGQVAARDRIEERVRGAGFCNLWARVSAVKDLTKIRWLVIVRRSLEQWRLFTNGD